MNDPGGDGEFAFHPPGIASEIAVSCLKQTESFQKLPGPCSPLGLTHTVKRRTKTQVVEAGKLRIQIAFIRNHTDQMLGRPGVSRTVDSADTDGSRIGAGQARKHIDGGGFSRPVGSEETEQFSSFNGKRNPRDRFDVVEVLGQILNGNGFGHFLIFG